MSDFEDTIAAIATPIGVGGLAVIRVSGAHAISVVEKGFRASGSTRKELREQASHTLIHGHILDGEQIVDEVMVALMRAPRTYTREDVVEISCHGGRMVSQSVLQTLLDSGARLAEPGEFTKRAFLSGRIDLTQAEAVADLIDAKTKIASRAAQSQLQGRLYREVEIIRNELISVLAHMEAHIDFPDEDISPNTQSELRTRVAECLRKTEKILTTADDGQVLREGLRLAIIGRPNVGKSSLLNVLLGNPRAIVSSVPGTTRDTIEEMLDIAGLPVRIVDTAGLRTTKDAIEQEGVQRSENMAELADMILLVLDESMPLQDDDSVILQKYKDKPSIIVRNKADLPSKLIIPGEVKTQQVLVSCAQSKGIEALKSLIKQRALKGDSDIGSLEFMLNARHKATLKMANAALSNTLEGLEKHLDLELIAMECRIALDLIGQIVGKTSTEDLLDSIFSQFCIGK